MNGFDATRSWQLDEQVALRPEPFGALAYHFGTRRLSFVKTKKLLAVIEQLGRKATASEALLAAGVTTVELPAYERALAALAQQGMIVEGETA